MSNNTKTNRFVISEELYKAGIPAITYYNWRRQRKVTRAGRHAVAADDRLGRLVARYVKRWGATLTTWQLNRLQELTGYRSFLSADGDRKGVSFGPKANGRKAKAATATAAAAATAAPATSQGVTVVVRPGTHVHIRIEE